MSDTYDFEDFEDNSPAGLRKALEKANKRAKEAEAKIAEAEKRALAAEKTAKKSTLTEILREKKVPTALARFIEKDDVEADAGAVDAWLKENGELFNIKPAEEAPAQEQQGQETAPVVETPGYDLPDDVVQALQVSQQIDATGVSPSEVGVLQRIQAISTDPSKVSYDQMIAELKATGAPMD